MRDLVCLITFSLMLCACSSASLQDAENIHYQQVNLKIPVEDLEFLKEKEFLSAMEAELLINKYTVWEQPRSQGQNTIEPDNWFYCGGIVIRDYEPDDFDDAAKFRVVGVTEDWIPIEGKVTRVLHLQMVNNW